MKFLITVLTDILQSDIDKIKEIFKVSKPFTSYYANRFYNLILQAVSEDPKLKIFRDSLQLFMNHFLLKQTKNTDLTVIKARIRIAEKSLTTSVPALRL